MTCDVEAGGAVSSHQGVNLPGADHDLPETGASDEPWIDFACENGIDLLAVSFVRRPSDLDDGRDPDQGARRGHPADREDREAAGRRAGRGDHRRGGQRDHGRPRRPRCRAPHRGGSGRAEAADHARRAGLQADHHRDPDAGDDGARLAPHPGGGDRRGKRDLRRHRRGDALRGDCDRRLPGGGRTRHGSDRPRDRAAPPLWGAGLHPSRGARARHRRDGGPGRGGRLLPAGPEGGRLSDVLGANRTADLGPPPARPGPRRLAAARDRPPDEPALRDQLDPGRGLDLDPQAAR